MLVRTNAIVLRRLRYSDTSIIATLLTEQRGVESILAKGARSPKSRMAAVLEPLEQIDVQYYVKSGRELQLLRAAERTVLRRSIQSSYEHTVAALRIAELVLRLELPGHPHAEVYELVEPRPSQRSMLRSRLLRSLLRLRCAMLRSTDSRCSWMSTMRSHHSTTSHAVHSPSRPRHV